MEIPLFLYPNVEELQWVLPTNLRFLIADPTPLLLPANTVTPCFSLGLCLPPSREDWGLHEELSHIPGIIDKPHLHRRLPSAAIQETALTCPYSCKSSYHWFRCISSHLLRTLHHSQPSFLSCGLSFSLSTGPYSNTATPLNSILSPAPALSPSLFIRAERLRRVLHSHSSNFPAGYSHLHLFQPNSTPATHPVFSH